MVHELTRNQSLVLESLTAAGAPLSAYAILDTLRPEGLKAPLQVYRALDKLMAVGLVHRLESLNAFIACTCGSHDRMTVFMICRNCGVVSERDAPRLGTGISDLAERDGFAVEGVVLEIKGLCRACRQQ